MRITTLTIERLRLFDRIELQVGEGINLLVGGNGAGKTSVLEAIHILSNGRSFRGGVRDSLIRHGHREFQLFAELLSEREQRQVRLGLSRSQTRWTARIDGLNVDVLSRLFQELAVVCFEPGSHALIAGSSEHRRRYLDWALFHVEPSFLGVWRRYQRALKQRNALLKQQSPPDLLIPWERELATQGAELHQMRTAWLKQVEPEVVTTAAEFLPTLGLACMDYSPGWIGDGSMESLLSSLESGRGRDLHLGHTATGPHRADWSIGFEMLPNREMFSRGQEKLIVLACLLAQAKTFAVSRGEWPVLLLDDLPSELDASHLGLTLDWLSQVPAQSFLTSTSRVSMPEQPARELRMFHVEQGQVNPLL